MRTIKLYSAEYTLTEHAETRVAQRGISIEALGLLLGYGHEIPTQNGCTKLGMRGAAIAELAAEGIAQRFLAEALSLTAIVASCGRIVTCYRLHRQRSKNTRRRFSSVPKLGLEMR